MTAFDGQNYLIKNGETDAEPSLADLSKLYDEYRTSVPHNHMKFDRFLAVPSEELSCRELKENARRDDAGFRLEVAVMQMLARGIINFAPNQWFIQPLKSFPGKGSDLCVLREWYPTMKGEANG